MLASYQVPSPDPGQIGAGRVTAALATALAAVPLGTFVYVNGYDHPPGIAIQLNPGDYVDVYTDTTVFELYTVDLTTSAVGYFSNTYQVYKDILHCPKAVNPTNLIVTTELLALTARRNADQVGCFIHRNERNGITQITHGDVGINTDIVNAYRTSLGTPDISIEVRLRAHTNHLIREAGYIDYLYLCSDATIVDFLTGRGDPSLPFWTAAALEQSAYVTDMMDTPSLITPQTLSAYVEALGFYTVMAAICRHDKTFTIDRLPVTGISVKKPLVLSGLPVYPLVYLDGIKLRDSQVDYANAHHDKVIFSLTPDVYAQPGQTLSVELIEAGASSPVLFTPTGDAPAITVPFSGVVVYQVNALAAPVIGYQTTAATSYAPVTLGPSGGRLTPLATITAAAGGGSILTFQEPTFGSHYLIQNAAFSRCYGTDITSQVAALQPLILQLETLCSDGTTVVPLLGYQSVAVYLNGRRLIEGIDYAANPQTDPSGNVAINQVVLCNRSALSLSGTNYLEVIAHTATEISRAVGYVTNNMINIKNTIETWYSGLSTAFANGYLLVNPTDAGDALLPSPPVANGVPFLVSASVPSFVLNVLNGIGAIADDQRIGLINTYLDQQPPINPIGPLIVEKSWQVYSPYLTAILHDAALAGQITLYNNDPDPALFRAQFSAYDYLLSNDPTITASISSIDLRYCDIYPTYKTIDVPDIATYTVLQRLAAMLLPPDSDTLGEVIND
jgi:hypothetical protein